MAGRKPWGARPGNKPLDANLDDETLDSTDSAAADFDWGDTAKAAGFKPKPYHRDPDENVQCPKCHKYDAPDAIFCDQCGTKLAGNPAVKVAKAVSGKPDGPDGDDNLEDEDELDGYTSVIVALFLDPDCASALAVAGGIAPADMHVTLAYVADDAAAFAADPDAVGKLYQAIGAMAINNGPVAAVTTGFGVLEGSDPGDGTAVALVDSPQVTALQLRVGWALEDFGMADLNEHGFLPHISLAYGDQASLLKLPLPGHVDLHFTSVSVAVGPQVVSFPLLGPEDVDARPAGFAMVKAASDLELGYTLAPLYVPDVDDSHGEYAKADDLRDMAWNFFRKDAADRHIYLQHMPGVVAGELVDQVVWPFEVTCELTTGTGITKAVRLPPGTVYQGVLWEPWAQPLVKADKITGLSMGGSAFKAAEE